MARLLRAQQPAVFREDLDAVRTRVRVATDGEGAAPNDRASPTSPARLRQPTRRIHYSDRERPRLNWTASVVTFAFPCVS